MKKKIPPFIVVASAIVSYLVGSAFATGQELMQFYVSNGVLGCIGSIIISAILLTWISNITIVDGHNLQLETANSIWRHYCGRVPGKVIEIYTIIFFFLLLLMMIAGAGAAVNQYFGIDAVYGRIAMAILVLFSVFLGMSRLTKVLGAIGIALIFLVLTVSIVGIAQNAGQIQYADAILAQKDVIRASDHWWLSGLLYPAFTIILFAPFLVGVSKEVSSAKEAKKSSTIGLGAIYVISTLVSFALLSTLSYTAEAEVPTQMMAAQIGGVFSFFYFLLLFLGIFTTSVSMLWLFCNSIVTDEKSRRFRILGVVTTIAAFFASVFPFSIIVNVILPNTGYIGFFVMICIFYRRYVHGRLGRTQPVSDHTNPL